VQTAGLKPSTAAAPYRLKAGDAVCIKHGSLLTEPEAWYLLILIFIPPYLISIPQHILPYYQVKHPLDVFSLYKM
jgi:hypothetical protein